MEIGIIGGTGPAGRGLATRLGAAGVEVVIGSRDPSKAGLVARELCERWQGRGMRISGADNEGAASAHDLVVVATPWESARSTAISLSGFLENKIVVSMVNALVKEGKEMLGVFLPRGSVAGTLQWSLPTSMVVAAFNHLPAADMLDLDSGLKSDVLVCSDHPLATSSVVDLVDKMDGLRGIDAGTLNQAGAIEAFTAVCITLNMRHRAHCTLGLNGI